MQPPNQPKVLIALSGGVDSAVAAALLLEQGYAVTGAYMVNYEGQNTTGESCWVHDYQDAARVAATLGIPLLKFDFTKEYQASVLDYLFAEYSAGRTPNPDVLCNKYIKFGSWLDKARELGFDFLATGHYARKTPENISRALLKEGMAKSPFEGGGGGMFALVQAKDTNKDQTYFLHQLSQEQLQHAMFPIGDYTKPEVRELAKKFNLPVADKEESMGICFVGEVPMKEFLKTKIKTKTGNIIMYARQTNVVGVENFQPLPIGQHDGLPFYTIGQRYGLSFRPSSRERRNPFVQKKQDDTKPLYVLAKNHATNELIVGHEDDPLLYKKAIELSDMHWISGQTPVLPLKCQVRFRHRQPLQQCVVEGTRNKEQGTNPPLRGARGMLAITCAEPQRAITPGQFAVFYASAVASAKEDKGQKCLGGGVIS